MFNMRRLSILLTILITSFVMALAGLVASPIATASENDGSISATFPLGSSVLTKDQKAAIKKHLQAAVRLSALTSLAQQENCLELAIGGFRGLPKSVRKQSKLI